MIDETRQAKVRINNTFLEFDDDDDTELLGHHSQSCIARIGPEVVDALIDDKDEDFPDRPQMTSSTMPEKIPFKGDDDLKRDFLDKDSPGLIGDSMTGQGPQGGGPWSPMGGMWMPGMYGYQPGPYASGPYPGPGGMGGPPGMPPMPHWVPSMQFPMANQWGQPYGNDGMPPYYGGQGGPGMQGGYGQGGGKGFGKGKSKTRGRGARSKNFQPEEEAAICEFERSIGIVREEPFVPEQEKTTLMFQNIPNKFNQKMLLKEVDARGFKGKYNFFYLPIDFKNRCNMGYAFINFLDVAWAKKFEQELTGVKLSSHSSKKTCAVVPARIQGLENNIAAYRNSPVIGIPVDSYKPLIFEDGVQVPFPDPEVPLPRVQLRNPKT